jgi:hypothetical protein
VHTDPLDGVEDAIMLPPQQDRAWMVSELGRLVRQHGFETFVAAHLVEPTPEFFPEPWTGGELSVARLARRLLHYAGIDDLDVRVVTREDAHRGGGGSGGFDSIVRFHKIVRGACVFEVWPAAVSECTPEVIDATTRAVTHAFRRHRRLSVADVTLEERLVDVTTVYLGFGVLTTRSRSHQTGKRLGVLSPRAMSFALAVLADVRGLTPKAVRRIVRKLGSNQAAFFKHALALLAQAKPSMRERYRIPDPDKWPAPRPLEELVEPTDDDVVEPERPRARDPGSVEKMNEGCPVFRVERTMSSRLGKVMGLSVMMLGMVTMRSFPELGVGMVHVMVGAAALGLVGTAIGRLLRESRCSEPKCGSHLEPDEETCPRCGGTVAGVISHPKQRLAAEEELARTKAGKKWG